VKLEENHKNNNEITNLKSKIPNLNNINKVNVKSEVPHNMIVNNDLDDIFEPNKTYNFTNEMLIEY